VSVLTSFQGIVNGGTSTYRVLRRDYARRRRWNKTTSTWKSTVSAGDAQETLSEVGGRRKGLYEVTTSGLGSPGLIHNYYKNIVSGRIVGGRRVVISDGSYLNTPDAEVTTDANKLRLDFWSDVAGAGDARYVAILQDRITGDTWNHAATAWQGSVSVDDAKIPLLEDDDETNLYGTLVSGLGNHEKVYASYYDLTSDPTMTTPRREEELRVSAGSIATPGAYPYKTEAMRAHGATNVARVDPEGEPDCRLTVRARTSPTLLARIVDSAGEPIEPDAITAIEYTVTEYREDDTSFSARVTGHTEASLTVADVILSSLQNDYLWGGFDDNGYNFVHLLNIASFEALPNRRRFYELEYTLTPASGQRFRLGYEVRTK
jgi:hypothetical protein